MKNPNVENTDNELYRIESLKLEIGRSLRTLTERQKQTICYFYGIGLEGPLSLEAISTKFDLTIERVRQIKDKAIEKLRKNGNFDVLRSYLG